MATLKEGHQINPLLCRLMTDYRDRIPAAASVMDMRNTDAEDIQPRVMQGGGWNVTTTQQAPQTSPTEPLKVFTGRGRYARPGTLNFKQGQWHDPVLAADQSMDLVIIHNEGVEAMTHEYLQKTLDNAARMLKPGGHLCLMCPGQFDDTLASTADCGVCAARDVPRLDYYSTLTTQCGLRLQETSSQLWNPDNHFPEFKHITSIIARKPLPLPEKLERHRPGLHKLVTYAQRLLSVRPAVHLDVPYFSQAMAEDPHGCWYHCLRMLRAWRGRDETAFPPFEGFHNETRHFDLQRRQHLELATREHLVIDYWPQSLSTGGIDTILEKHGPILFSWKPDYRPGSFPEMSHMSVIVGTEKMKGEDWVIYHDPGRAKNMRMKLDRFNQWRCLDTGSVMMYPADENSMSALSFGPADINKKDCHDATALMLRANFGDEAAVKDLVARKGDMDVQNTQGYTALMMAVENRHTKCVAALVEAGADVNLRNCAGRSALWLASSFGNADAARILLDAGAKVDQVDRWGWSPTMVAARWENIRSLQALLEREPDLGLRASKGPTWNSAPGSTALHLAAEYGQPGSVHLLIKAGADRSAQDDNGDTPAMKAEKYKKEIAVTMLNTYR